MTEKVITSAEVRSSLDASAYTAGADKLAAANEKVTQSNEKVVQSDQRVERQRVQGAGAIERMLRRLDPVIKAQQDYERQLKMVQRVQAEGETSADRISLALGLLAEKYKDIDGSAARAAKAQEEAAKAQEDLAKAWRATRAGLDPAIAAQDAYGRVVEQSEKAVKAGVATQAEANQTLEQARQRYLGTAPAVTVFSRATEEAERSARSWASRIPIVGGLLGGINGAALAAAAGIGVLTAGLAFGVAKAAEAERIHLRLEQVLKATGNTTGLQAKQIDEYAQSLERVTLAQSDAVKQAAAVLAASQTVAGERFKEVIALAQDYVAVYGGDVASATRSFARAMEEPERAIGMLRKAGIALSDSQKEMIRDFVAVGERAKAQQVILDQLRERVGGAGAAETGGLTGAVNQLGKAWEDLQKGLGYNILEPTTVSVRALADGLRFVTENASGALAALRSLPGFGGGVAQLGAAAGAGTPPAALLDPARLGAETALRRETARLHALLTDQQVLSGDEMSDLLQRRLGIDAEASLRVDELREKYGELSKALNPLEQQIKANHLQQDLLINAFQAGIVSAQAFKDQLKQLGEQAEKLRSPVDQLIKSQEDALKLSGLHPRARARLQAEDAVQKAANGQPDDPDLAAKITRAGQLATSTFDRDAAYGFGRSLEQYDMQAAGLAKVAEAYKVSTAEAEKAELRLRAEIETRDLGRAATEKLYGALLQEAEARKAVEAAKLLADTAQQAAEQEMLTAAVGRGVAEYEKTATAIEVARRVQQGFFKEGSEQAKAYAAALDQIKVDRAREALTRNSVSIEQNNEILAAELRLVGATVEQRSREIALLKIKHQLQNANIDAADEEARRYANAVRQGELLNRQVEKARQQQELLMEPFRNFIRGMQDALGQFFDDLFEGNVNTWKSAFASIKQLAKQFAVEMLKLLTIQPVINWITGGQGLPGMGGGVSFQSIANLFGGSPGTGSPYAGGGSLGGGLFGGTPGSLGGFLSRPIGSMGMGLEAYSQLGVAGLPQPGGWLGGLSIGQGLSAIAGAGMGIHQIAQGGTANTIGGIASLIGAGVSLIPGVGQILGPIISIAGALLPGLFGNKKPTKPLKSLQLLTSGGGLDGFERGGATATTPFGTLGWDRLGTNQQFVKTEFSDNVIQAIADIDRALADLLTQAQIEQVASALQRHRGVQHNYRENPDREAFDVLKDRLQVTLGTLYGSSVASKGLEGIARSNENVEELANRAAEIIQLKNAIADFGKETTAAEQAVKSINDQLDDLKRKADQYGFGDADLAKIEAERRRLINKLAIDFNEGVAQQLLAMENPFAAAMAQLEKDQAERLKEAEYLNTVSDVLVDINKLEELFGKERVRLHEQFLEQLGQKWSDFEKELLFGDVSGLTNRQQYEAAMREYNDVRDRANAAWAANDNLDPALAAEFQNEALAALQWSRTYMASSRATQQLYDEVLRLTRLFGDLPGYATGTQLARPGWAMVGEQGAELVRLPGGARVFSATDTSRILSGPSFDMAALHGAFRAALREVMADVVRENAMGFGRLHQDFERLEERLTRRQFRDDADDAARRSRGGGARRRQFAA